MNSTLVMTRRYNYVIRDVCGRVLESGSFKNGIPLVGLNESLDILYGATSKNASIFIGLIAHASTITLASGDSASSHTGWTEETGYSQAARPTLSFSAAAAGIIVAAAATFTASSAISIGGAFLITNSTKGGSTGTLHATGLFGATAATWRRNLASGQSIAIDCTVNLSGG